MPKRKLSDQEAKELANKIAQQLIPVTPSSDTDLAVESYMRKYNEVMDSIEKYNSSII